MSNAPFEKLRNMLGRKDGDEAPGLSPERFRQGLEQSLAESPTGRRLLSLASQQRIAIHVITGKGSSGYLPENRGVFISMPPGLSTVSEELVLELGAYLRHAELQLLGHKNPDISMDSEDYTVAFDSKMIDSLAVMCKIASELYEKGKTNFVDALVRMGHGEVYETYRKYGQGQELVDVYYKISQKTG